MNEAQGGEQVGQKNLARLVCDEALSAEGATVIAAAEARPAERVRLGA